jgi:S-adenosylmethionine hydrolase
MTEVAMNEITVTLTTDFGEASPYVAAMKGGILSINPRARLLDLTHQIPPQNVRHAAYYLASALPYFPGSALHVVVVDPGVGTERAILYIESGGHRLLAPDNGCWTQLVGAGRSPTVIRVADSRYWRQPVSDTFHGRDIFAPVAGHLSLGLDPRLLGPPASQWIQLTIPEPRVESRVVYGQVVFVDDFGNLISNISRSLLTDPAIVRIANTEIRRWVRSYGEAKEGDLVALLSSNGTVEVAVCQGNAANHLKLGINAPVQITPASVDARQ